MHRRILQTAIGALVALLISCAGVVSPVEPVNQGGPGLPLSAMRSLDSHSAPVLLGYWDVFFDPETLEIEILPNRSVDFALNIVKFLNNDPSSLSITIDVTSIDNQPDYLDISVDVTIVHPIDDAGFDAYDVRTIFIGNGSGVFEYNPDLIGPVPGTDQVLRNADGYTRWWNPSEFYVEKIFGYVPGLMALPPGYEGTATLNGYKYFGDGLEPKGDLWDYLISGAGDVGYFYHDTNNTRTFDLTFPKPDLYVKFGYAVVANWEGTEPSAHPSHADEAVGIDTVIISYLFYDDETTNGGEVTLDLCVFDWHSELTGGVMEDYRIILESPVLLDPYTLNTSEMTPTASGNHFFTYHVEFQADGVPSSEDQPLWIIVEYPDTDYTNPFGVPNDADGDPVAAVFLKEMYVMEFPPPILYITAPNGGEQWSSGTTESITWFASSDIQHVDLEYSKDDFNFDVNTIATDLLAFNGAYDWNVPFDGSETVKVRVKESADPDVSDESDDYFTIVAPEASITVLSPNGGENFIIGSDQTIYWTSVNVTGTLFIEYSDHGFFSPMNTIALDAENNGEFLWENIPDVPSDQIRVRIRSNDVQSVFDDSDEDFSIVEGVPESGWASTWGGENSDYYFDTALDTDGNVYAAGCYGAQYEIVLEKLSSGGDSLWRVQWPSGWSVFFGVGVAVDGSGNSYVCGTFCGTDMDFDPGPDEDLHSSMGESPDSFLSKFDSNGNHEWTLQWGGYGDDAARDVELDNSGNIYVTGYFREDLIGNAPDFDPGLGEDIQHSTGDYDACLSKFDSSGVYQWALVWGGEEFEYGHNLDVSSAGYVCIAGNFSGSDADFDPGTNEFLLNSVSSMDVYVTKLNSDGEFQWAVNWPGWYFGYNGIAQDYESNVYVSGGFTETVDFDPGPGIEERTEYGGLDACLSKFDPDGNFLWVSTWGGSDDYDTAVLVECDGLGNVCTTGMITGDNIDFDPGPDVDIHDSNGYTGAFLCKYNSSGEYLWGRDWGAFSDENAMGIGVAISESGNIFISGFFSGVNAEFAPVDAPCVDDSDFHASAGTYDTFVMKFLPDGCW